MVDRVFFRGRTVAELVGALDGVDFRVIFETNTILVEIKYQKTNFKLKNGEKQSKIKKD